MCKLFLALLMLVFSPTTAKAVEFFISDPIVSNLDISISASISASSNYYLQGLLRSQLSSKYFGESKGRSGNWIDYISSPEKEYIVSNFFLTDIQNASWSGKINMRFKIDDPNYFGPGVYDLKFRRFTGNSNSSAGESNTISLNLTPTLPSPSPIPSPSIAAPSPTNPNPSPTPSPVISPTPKPAQSPVPSVYMASPPVGTVAGTLVEIDLSSYGTSPSPKPSLSGDSQKSLAINRSRLNITLVIGGGLILLSLACILGLRQYHRLPTHS